MEVRTQKYFLLLLKSVELVEDARPVTIEQPDIVRAEIAAQRLVALATLAVTVTRIIAQPQDRARSVVAVLHFGNRTPHATREAHALIALTNEERKYFIRLAAQLG